MSEDRRNTPLSLQDRRDIIWNFTEPGDPYDIRKYPPAHAGR